MEFLSAPPTFRLYTGRHHCARGTATSPPLEEPIAPEEVLDDALDKRGQLDLVPVSLGVEGPVHYDAPLVQDALGIFVRAVFASLRRRARSRWASPAPRVAPSPSCSASATR